MASSVPRKLEDDTRVPSGAGGWIAVAAAEAEVEAEADLVD